MQENEIVNLHIESFSNLGYGIARQDGKVVFVSNACPEDEIEALAKCFLPDILDFFESEEGRKEFEQWKREQIEKDKQ